MRVVVAELDLVWAAGLFEGEGSVMISRPSARQRAALYASVPNVDREILAFFHDRWPGSVRIVGTSGGRRQEAWRWTIAARKAAAFLRAIEPYVRTRRVREKVALGLEFQDQKGAPGARVTQTQAYRLSQIDYYNRLRLLNKRGTGPDPEPFDGAAYLGAPSHLTSGASAPTRRR